MLIFVLITLVAGGFIINSSFTNFSNTYNVLEDKLPNIEAFNNNSNIDDTGANIDNIY